MDYDPEYKPIIDYILEILSQGNFPVFTRSDTSLMTKLYNEITLGNVTARGALARGCFKNYCNWQSDDCANT